VGGKKVECSDKDAKRSVKKHMVGKKEKKTKAGSIGSNNQKLVRGDNQGKEENM